MYLAKKWEFIIQNLIVQKGLKSGRKVLQFEPEQRKRIPGNSRVRGRLYFCRFRTLELWWLMRNMKTHFKQYDPAPRYNARDMAVVLANHHKAQVLLGSATPSLESYLQCNALVNMPWSTCLKCMLILRFRRLLSADVKRAYQTQTDALPC
jgi:primosomal protein N' (replication factor Y) (superfamily II helicase)